MALTGSQVDGNDIIIETVALDKLDKLGTSPNQVLRVNAVGNLEYGTLPVDTIDGISSAGASTGDSLVWNGSGWVPGSPGNGGGGNTQLLDELLDVALTSPANGEILKYNSTSSLWENTTINYSELTGAPTLVTAIDQLTDVTITTPTNNQFMVYSGSGWLNIGLTKALISDFVEGDYATAAQGIKADSAIQTGANVSIFVNDSGYLTAATAPAALGLATVATTGDYSDLLNIPATFAPSAHTHVKANITDFSDGDYATAAQGTKADTAIQPGANVSVFNNDANYFSNITVTTPATNQGLIFNGTTWVNAGLTKSLITDFNDGDYATAAQGTKADTALQSSANISLLSNDIGYITSGSLVLDTLNDVSTTGAAAGQILKYNGTSWQPQNDIAGEINTASSLGAGQSVFGAKVSSDLQFKSLVAGTDISITANANEITINSTATGEANTASNLGSGHGTFSSKLASDLQFKSIIAGANVTLNSTTDDITIAVPTFDYTNLTSIPATFAPTAHTHVKADITDFVEGDYATAAQGTTADSAVQPGANLSIFSNDAGYLSGTTVINDLADVNTSGASTGQVLKYNGSAWLAANDTDTGEANTASNLGSGTNVFAGKVAADLEFKSIIAGPNVTITNDANEITIQSAIGGEINTASNLGAGNGVFAGKNVDDLQFRSLKAGSNISLTSSGTEITIDASGISSLTSLTDTTITTPATNQGLIFNGTTWVNAGLTKSLITDFNDADYATAAQGAASSTAIQPNDNVSSLLNDIGYLTGGSGINDLLDVNTAGLVQGDVLKYNGSEWLASADASGEANSGVNATGTGEGIYIGKIGTDLNFKRIKAGAGLSISSDTNEITIASTASLGETNTASSVGLGDSIVSGKVGTDLQFKSLKAGNNITLTTTGADITINSASGATNLDGLSDVSITGATGTNILVHNGAQFVNQFLTKSLISDFNDGDYATAAQGATSDTAVQPADNISVLQNDHGYLDGGSVIDDLINVVAPSPSEGQILKYISGVWNAVNDTGATVSGEINTASNLSGDQGLFVAKVSEDLQFKSISAGPGILVTSNSTEVFIESTASGAGEANTASDKPGTGEGITAPKVGSDLQFKRIKAGTNITVSSDSNEITINSTGGASSSIVGLTDTANTPLANNFLQWNGAGTTVKYVDITKNDIIDFSDGDYATAAQGTTADSALQNINLENLGDLANVSEAGATNADVLTYNGTSWVAATPSASGLLNVVEDVTPQLGGDLDVNGQSIVSAANANINITPNGTGKTVIGSAGTVAVISSGSGESLSLESDTSVIVAGFTFPATDGTAGQALVTDASGNLGWATPGAGADGNDFVTGFTFVGGALTATVPNQTNPSISLDGRYALLSHGDHVPTPANPADDGKVLTASGGTTSWATAATSGLANVVEDLTPQLGGDLDIYDGATAHAITTTEANGDITIAPNGTGDVIIGGTGAAVITSAAAEDLVVVPGTGGSLILNNLYYPSTDTGNSGYVLTTDGAGNLSFQQAPGAGGGEANVAAWSFFGVTGNVTGDATLAANVNQSTLNIVAGTNIDMVSNNTTRTLTINATGTTAADVVVDGDFTADGFLLRSGGAGAYTTQAEIAHSNITGGTAATNVQYLSGDGTWTTPAGAGDVNQFAFSNITVAAGTGTASGGPVAADTTTDTLNLVAGNNITLTAVAGTDTITIDSAGGAGTTNLAYTAAPTTGTVTSSTGTDATIPLADGTNAGLMTPAEKTAIAANTAKVTNVTTNLGYTASTIDGTVTSSDGTDATIPLAVAAGNAGLMSGTDKTKLDGLTGAGEANQNAFTTVAVSGQSDVVADLASDTLNLVAGTNVTLTTTPGTDSITIDAAGGGGASPLTTKGDIYTYDTGDARLPVGTDGQVLTANSSTGTGVEWATPSTGGGASYEYAVFQFESGDTLNQAATTNSAGVTIAYVDPSSANVVGFTFSGYNIPPASIVVYSQDVANGEWAMLDGSALIDTPIKVADANGTTSTPDLIDFNIPFTGQITMGLTKTNTKANNKTGLPTIFAKVMVKFLMVG